MFRSGGVLPISSWLERVRAALAPKGYDVDRELASGGMGTVFLARQRALSRFVALKVIRPELFTAAAAERFEREAETLAGFSHPNIVPIHDADEADGLPYYVMDYLPGHTLADRLRDGALRPAEALKLGRDLLDALEAAHAHGVVHRDVKPENVFLLSDRAMLTDFGIAKRIAERAPELTATGAVSAAAERSSRTRTGAIVGTLDYMPPEQVAGDEITPRTDLYAAAMVIYEAYTGRHWELADPPAGAAWSGVPRRAARVLRRGVAFAPEDRWPSAAVFRRRLWRTRHWPYQRRTILLALGSLVAGSAAGVWVVPRWERGLPPFTPPGALELVVAPFVETCTAGARTGDRVGRALVRDLEGFPDFSVRGPAAPSWLTRRSTPVVRATVCTRGDSVRVEIEARAGGTGPDARVIATRGDTGAADAIADSLAYGVVRDVWDRETPLDPSLPVRALPRTSQGLSAWLEAERLLAQGRWGEADRAYSAAEAVDSTCWLCAWRHAEVDQWLGRSPDRARAERYLSHVDSFPPSYQSLIRASRMPLGPRLAMLERATRQAPTLFLAHFMAGDELFHRGPLAGRAPEEAVEAFQRVVHLRPDFLPAWEHLTWALTQAGLDSAAKNAYARLEASGPARDPFSQELRALLGLALACRFDGSVACRRVLEVALAGTGTAAYPDLAAGPRYLATFDAPRGAVLVGRRFAALGDEPALVRSGLVAQVAGDVALGLVDSARAAALELRERFREPALDVFPAELDGALLLLDPGAPDDAARWGAVRRALAEHTSSHASTAATRRRAAWMLLLLDRRLGGLGDPARYGLLVRGEPRPAPLAGVLEADSLERSGRPALALEATDRLAWLTADGLGDPAGADPFLRAVLHMLRARWDAERGDLAGAEAELGWHWNSDFFGRPDGLPQVGDLDWAFATVARWRLAGLADAAGERRACRDYAAVIRLWVGGGPRYRARADSAGRRRAALGCREPG